MEVLHETRFENHLYQAFGFAGITILKRDDDRYSIRAIQLLSGREFSISEDVVLVNKWKDGSETVTAGATRCHGVVLSGTWLPATSALELARDLNCHEKFRCFLAQFKVEEATINNEAYLFRSINNVDVYCRKRDGKFNIQHVLCAGSVDDDTASNLYVLFGDMEEYESISDQGPHSGSYLPFEFLVPYLKRWKILDEVRYLEDARSITNVERGLELLSSKYLRFSKGRQKPIRAPGYDRKPRKSSTSASKSITDKSFEAVRGRPYILHFNTGRRTTIRITATTDVYGEKWNEDAGLSVYYPVSEIKNCQLVLEAKTLEDANELVKALWISIKKHHVGVPITNANRRRDGSLTLNPSKEASGYEPGHSILRHVLVQVYDELDPKFDKAECASLTIQGFWQRFNKGHFPEFRKEELDLDAIATQGENMGRQLMRSVSAAKRVDNSLLMDCIHRTLFVARSIVNIRSLEPHQFCAVASLITLIRQMHIGVRRYAEEPDLRVEMVKTFTIPPSESKDSDVLRTTDYMKEAGIVYDNEDGRDDNLDDENRKREPPTCKACNDQEFENWDEYYRHVYRHDMLDDYFKCRQCNQKFKTYDKLKQHNHDKHRENVPSAQDLAPIKVEMEVVPDELLEEFLPEETVANRESKLEELQYNAQIVCNAFPDVVEDYEAMRVSLLGILQSDWLRKNEKEPPNILDQFAIAKGSKKDRRWTCQLYHHGAPCGLSAKASGQMQAHMRSHIALRPSRCKGKSCPNCPNSNTGCGKPFYETGALNRHRAGTEAQGVVTWKKVLVRADGADIDQSSDEDSNDQPLSNKDSDDDSSDKGDNSPGSSDDMEVENEETKKPRQINRRVILSPNDSSDEGDDQSTHSYEGPSLWDSYQKTFPDHLLPSSEPIEADELDDESAIELANVSPVRRIVGTRRSNLDRQSDLEDSDEVFVGRRLKRIRR